MNTTIEQAPDKTTIRDTLFGDFPLSYWAGIDTDGTPWSLFKQAKRSLETGNEEGAIGALRAIVTTPGLESRHYLQACHFLRQLDAQHSSTVTIYGMVVEVAMEGGIDLLAVYTDHTARYYNYAGGGVVLEHEDAAISAKIDTVIQYGYEIIPHIGPWEGARPGLPANGYARLNMLTSHGLFFGEAPQMTLFNDALAGKTMYTMLSIMEALINKSNGL